MRSLRDDVWNRFLDCARNDKRRGDASSEGVGKKNHAPSSMARDCKNSTFVKASFLCLVTAVVHPGVWRAFPASPGWAPVKVHPGRYGLQTTIAIAQIAQVAGGIGCRALRR